MFSNFASAVARATGRPISLAAAVLIVLVWLVSGPLFGFSETWQLVINTGTTIITFLMLFVLQNSQNRDGAALQAKIDQLILVSGAANNLVGAERMEDAEIERMHKEIVEAAGGHLPEGQMEHRL